MPMSLGQKAVAMGALLFLNTVVWVAGLSALTSGRRSGLIGVLIFGAVIVTVGASSLGIAKVLVER
jgi:hypothetical protein